MSRYQPTYEERLIATITQIMALPLAFIAPLIVLLVEGRRSPYIRYWAKVAMFWQIFWLIGMIVAGLLAVVVIGCFVVPFLIGMDLVLCVLAAVKAYYNEPFGYWFVADLVCRRDYELLYGPAGDAVEAATVAPPAEPRRAEPEPDQRSEPQQTPDAGQSGVQEI